MAPKINPKLQCQKIGYFFRENSKASQFKSWNMLSCIHSWLYSKFFKSVQERSNSWLYLHVRVLIGADFRSVGHFHTFLFHKRTINILLIDVLNHWLIVIAAQILKQYNFSATWHLSKLQFDLHCCNHRSWPLVSSRYLRRPFWQCLQCCQPWCSLAFENWSLNTTCVICVVGVTV